MSGRWDGLMDLWTDDWMNGMVPDLFFLFFPPDFRLPSSRQCHHKASLVLRNDTAHGPVHKIWATTTVDTTDNHLNTTTRVVTLNPRVTTTIGYSLRSAVHPSNIFISSAAATAQ